MLREAIHDLGEFSDGGGLLDPDDVAALVLAVRRQALEEAALGKVVYCPSCENAGECKDCNDISNRIRALPVSLDGPAPELKL